MDMEFILPRHTVDLRNSLVLLQCFRHLCQRVRQCFDFKIAGHRAADLLRIDDGGVLPMYMTTQDGMSSTLMTTARSLGETNHRKAGETL